MLVTPVCFQEVHFGITLLQGQFCNNTAEIEFESGDSFGWFLLSCCEMVVRPSRSDSCPPPGLNRIPS